MLGVHKLKFFFIRYVFWNFLYAGSTQIKVFFHSVHKLKFMSLLTSFTGSEHLWSSILHLKQMFTQ